MFYWRITVLFERKLGGPPPKKKTQTKTRGGEAKAAAASLFSPANTQLQCLWHATWMVFEPQQAPSAASCPQLRRFSCIALYKAQPLCTPPKVRAPERSVLATSQQRAPCLLVHHQRWFLQRHHGLHQCKQQKGWRVGCFGFLEMATHSHTSRTHTNTYVLDVCSHVFMSVC